MNNTHTDDRAPGGVPYADDHPGEPGRLSLGRADLAEAVRAGILTQSQATLLWEWSAGAGLAGRAAAAPGAAALQAGPRFSFVNVLYYLGGLLAMGAMTLFMTLAWDALGPWGLTVLACLYFVGAVAVTRHFLARDLHVPAGLMGALAVCLVPLCVWGAQQALGLWPDGSLGNRYADYHVWIDWRWLFLELATLAAGLVMLWWLRLPFMVMPVAVTLWYMSMDVGNMIMQSHGFDWELARTVTLVFGLFTLFVAAWMDVRTRRATQAVWRQDFAFWLYIFGGLMFWAGLSFMDSDSELGKLGYGLINAGLILLGAAIGRRVFTVLGALGVAGYLGHLAWDLFRDSLVFPVALTLLGLAVIALGVWWQRHEADIHRRLSAWVPAGLRPRGLVPDSQP